MKNKNALNPYRIESEEYYFLRGILASRGIDVPDERKREHRHMLAAHADPLEKSARQEWRELGNGACYRIFPWEGETEDELNRLARLMSSSPASAGAFYYSAHVARTGRNGEYIAAIVYANIDD